MVLTRTDREAAVAAALRLADGGAAEPVAAFAGDYDEAMAVQIAVANAIRARRPGPRAWKVGLTSGPSRDLLGIGIRPFGGVSRVFATNSTIDGPRFGPAKIEPELCLTVGRELFGSDLSRAEIRAAISQASAAFEINESRLPKSAPLPAAIADGLGQWGIVVGGGTAEVSDSLAETAVTLYRDGEVVSQATGTETMDDPLLSLSRLCSNLARFDQGLGVGDRIITGAFASFSVDETSHWRAVFSGIGEVTANVVMAARTDS